MSEQDENLREWIKKCRLTDLDRDIRFCEEKLAWLKAERERLMNASDTAMPIEELDLDIRTFNALRRGAVYSIDDILTLLQRGDDALLEFRHIGQQSLQHIKTQLRVKGFDVATS